MRFFDPLFLLHFFDVENQFGKFQIKSISLTQIKLHVHKKQYFIQLKWNSSYFKYIFIWNIHDDGLGPCIGGGRGPLGIEGSRSGLGTEKKNTRDLNT